MLKTYLYIPEQLEEKINLAVKTQKRSKAEILRTALNEGLHVMEKQNVGGAKTLLKLAEIGKKAQFNGVHDSARMDEQLWGKDWSKDE